MAADNRNNSHVSNYELMETIRKYEAIYNSTGEYHKNGKMLKKDAWAAVADELNIDIAEAQNRYGNIRTVFSRYLKTIRRQQTGGGGPGTYRLGEDVPIKDGFEYLRWLIAHIKPRNCVGEQEPLESDEGEDTATWSGVLITDGFEDSVSGHAEGNSIIQAMSLAPSPSHAAPRATKRTFHSSPSSMKKYVKSKAKRPMLAAVNSPRRVADENRGSSNTHDEDMMFCMSLVPKMRRLPERYKTAAQLRILQVVCDFESADSVPMSQLSAQTAVVFPSQGGTWQPQGVAITQGSDTQPSSLQQ
ncbi:uncharacterized protein LOC119731210 [Patiria miniata]|uniref:MADF domain-containing protein n=1 Tax=Patiria miniata TaxID=46514 RepID=A0A914A9V2_PATMI|nr:uncharacterized protein LOC119731210 [Patiria miniata]